MAGSYNGTDRVVPHGIPSLGLFLDSSRSAS